MQELFESVLTQLSLLLQEGNAHSRLTQGNLPGSCHANNPPTHHDEVIGQVGVIVSAHCQHAPLAQDQPVQWEKVESTYIVIK